MTGQDKPQRLLRALDVTAGSVALIGGASGVVRGASEVFGALEIALPAAYVMALRRSAEPSAPPPA